MKTDFGHELICKIDCNYKKFHVKSWKMTEVREQLGTKNDIHVPKRPNMKANCLTVTTAILLLVEKLLICRKQKPDFCTAMKVISDYRCTLPSH